MTATQVPSLPARGDEVLVDAGDPGFERLVAPGFVAGCREPETAGGVADRLRWRFEDVGAVRRPRLADRRTAGVGVHRHVRSRVGAVEAPA